MQGSLRMIAVLLLAATATCLARTRWRCRWRRRFIFSFILPGCHSHKPTAPAVPAPTSYQCCVNGHHAAIPEWVVYSSLHGCAALQLGGR